MHIIINSNQFAILSKLHKIASTDNTRPALCAIKLSLAGDQLTAVATDSYILAEYTTKIKDPEGDFDILIDGKQFSQLAKLYDKPLGFFTLEYTDDTVTVGGLDGSVTAPRIRKDYPNYKPLVPKLDLDQVDVPGTFDVTLLGRIMSILPKKTPMRFIQGDNPMNSMRIHTDIDGLTLLIMPLKSKN